MGAADRAFIDKYTSGFAAFEADATAASWEEITAASGLYPRVDRRRGSDDAPVHLASSSAGRWA